MLIRALSRHPAARTRSMARRRRSLNLEGLENRQVLSGIWVGGHGTLWSTAANWDDGKVPTASTHVQLGPGAEVVLDGNAVARSIDIQGSLDLGTYTLTVNATANPVATGFIQSGDTSSLTAQPGGALVVGGNFTHTAGLFDVDNVTFVGVNTGTITSNLTFENVTIAYGSHHLKIANGQPLDVNGNLTITGFNTITGDIYAAGNVTTSAAASSNISSGTLYLDGKSAQTLTGIGSGGLPNVVNQKAVASTLTLAGSISPENWSQVSGGLSASGSTTTFRRSANAATVNTGTTSLGNVVVNAGSQHFRVTKLNVGGDLTIQSATNFLKGPGAPDSRVVTVTGNLTSLDASVSGEADIVMIGAANATITAIDADFPNGGITLDKGLSPVITANVTKPLDSLLTIDAVGGLKGTFAVGRNVVTNDTALNGNGDGSPVLVFAGSENQKLTSGVPNGAVPGIEINKTGGSFTLVDNGNVNGSNALRVYGSWIVNAGNTAPVNLANSRIKISGGGQPITLDTGNSAGFNDLELASGSSSIVTIPNTSTAIVNGELTLSLISRITGTIEARGNVTTSDTSVSSGPGTILFNGAGNQTLTAAPTGGQVPGVTINKSAGTLTVGTDPIGVSGDWIYTKGLTNLTGSTIVFQGGNTIVDAGTSPSMSFYNVEIDKGMSPSLTVTNKLDVKNDLTIRSVSSLNAALGAITVGRNLTSLDTSVGGSTNITMNGNSDAQIIGGDFPNGGIIIHKGSAAKVTANVTQPLDGPLTLSSMSTLQGTFQVGADVTTSDTGISGNSDGSPVLIFKGNRAQTLIGAVANAMVPGVGIDKNGGSLKLQLPLNPNGGGYDPLQVSGGWIVEATNTAPVNLANSHIRFQLSGGFGHRTIDTGNTAGFHTVDLNAGSGATVTINKMVVNGDLILSSASAINGDNIDVHGDVITQSTTSMSGSSRIRFVGTGNQALAATLPNRKMPGVIIEKPSGTLSIGQNGNTIDVTGHWTYIGTGNDVNAAGSTIRFVGGTKIIRSGAMRFDNVIFGVGSADHVEVLADAPSNDPGVLFYTGTVTNPNKVTKGTLTLVP
jgi:hypothetical protein